MLNPRLLFVALAWGVNFSVVKFAIADIRPLGFTVLRFSLAALFLLLLLRLRGEPFSLDREDRLPVVRLGLLGIVLYNVLFMYGIERTTAANSALLISLSPLVGALITALQGRERLTPHVLSGLLLAFFGVALIISSRQGAVTFSTSGLTGDLLTLAATVTWALYTITARPLLRKYSALKITALNMAAGSALLLPLSVPDLMHQQWTAIPVLSWLGLGFSAFIAAGIAYVFWYDGVRILGVTKTMAYHYLMPVAAVLFSAVALREQITGLQAIGGCAILCGVYLVQRR